MRMSYVKRSCSSAGKISVSHFKELHDEFLADNQAETLMHEIPDDLIFNWDQTGLSLVPTGKWTMHQAKATMIPITHGHCSSCCYPERQIPAPSTCTIYLHHQVICQGKTVKCHPKVAIPSGWDIWHSPNHWSNEEAMKWYVKKLITLLIGRKGWNWSWMLP